MDMCSSPRLFAAYRGLLRLTAPRHSPWTYASLDHIIVSARAHFLSRHGAPSVKLRPDPLASREPLVLPSSELLTFVIRSHVSLP